MRNLKLFWLIISGLIFVTSCSKNDEINTNDDTFETILQEKTIVANTQQSESGIISINDNQIVINNSYPNFSEINNGYVLVGDQSTHSRFGYALKVLNVTNNGSSKTILTEPATMLDIFKQADFKSELGYLNVSDTLHLRSAETYFEFAIDKVLYDYDGNSSTDNDQIKISGTAKFRVSKPEFQWRKRENEATAEKTKLLIEIEDLSEIEVIVGAQAENKWLWPGMTYTIPIKFYVPTPIGIPVPVFLPTTVNAGSSGKIEINLGLNANFKSNGKVIVGFEYSNGQWTNLSSASFNPTFVNSGSYFGVNGSIVFYPLDIDAKVNPYYQEIIEAELGAKIGLKNTLSINSQSITNKIDAVVSVYGGINGDFKKWLGVNADISFTLEIFNYNLLNQSLPNTIPTDGLVAYYPFNGNANDESGNGNNGTIIGNVTQTSDRKGLINGAYLFNAQPFNYISVPHNSSLVFNSFTLNAWIYTETDFGGGFIINKGRDITDGSYSLRSNAVTAQVLYNGINGAYNSSSLNSHNWHMVTGIVSGNSAKFYVNGILVDQKTLSNVFNCTGTNPLTLGMHFYPSVPSHFTYPFKGKIDDVRIYNRVLSLSEIELLYNE